MASSAKLTRVADLASPHQHRYGPRQAAQHLRHRFAPPVEVDVAVHLAETRLGDLGSREQRAELQRARIQAQFDQRGS
jgi:hypothetical protein